LNALNNCPSPAGASEGSLTLHLVTAAKKVFLKINNFPKDFGQTAIHFMFMQKARLFLRAKDDFSEI